MAGLCKFKEKRGSTVIFLGLILGSMMILTVNFVAVSAKAAQQSALDGACTIAGRAILSEYDTRLYEDYGIFAFYGDQGSTAKKIKYYLNWNLNETKTHLNFDKVDINVQLKEFSLTDINNFEEQIVTAAKYGIADYVILESKEELAGYSQLSLTNAESSANNEGAVKPLKNKNARNTEYQHGEKTLRNQRVAKTLPSAGFTLRGLNLSIIEGIELAKGTTLLHMAGNKLFVTNYILNNFSHRLEPMGKKGRFFNNEVEYILCGKLSDKENSKKLYTYIVELRTPINIAKIYNDSSRAGAALAAAQAITPGPQAVLTQLAIITAWAVTDSKAEADKLVKGKEVGGLGYEEYLKIFMSIQDRETMLLRIMDLIQINLRNSYNGTFLLKECYYGLEFSAKTDGKEYRYKHRY